ncbi:uncharacterized protein LOC135815366 isoform X2 [Sycon ciliatum]|uniref:uncharacterized protein LOC135815366 isoform X2 n=1 Tax=Sycon ciliatum TaxID=27933 RepID=UPI0031F63B5B
MAGANFSLLLSNFLRQKRAVLGLIFIATVAIIVLVTSNGENSKGGKRGGSLASLVNWAQLGHQEDDAESRGESHVEGEQDSQPVFGDGVHLQTGHSAAASSIPHYLSPEARLKRIAATFAERNLGDENLCAAIKRGEISVDRHKRRGGKKSAWIATWKGKKIVVKRNDFEVSVALNKHLFYAWDRNDDGRVERVEFFKSLSNAMERMGIYEEELDNVFHTADVNRDGVLNVKEVLLGAAIVYERYNQMLAPEALILGENPDLNIFPSYFGHCNNSYFVEFLPMHSLHPMKKSQWSVRSKLALGLLDWAKVATEKGLYACDMILGNFGQGEDGVIKINDLDQVHSHEDVKRWEGLPCTPGTKGIGCFDDGHCRMVCQNNGKCPIMPPHHNYKEICGRLFMKKQFLDNPPVRIARDVSILVRTCAHGESNAALQSALKLATLLAAESEHVGSILPPSFQGQVRYGKLLDVPSHDDPAAASNRLAGGGSEAARGSRGSRGSRSIQPPMKVGGHRR